MVGEYREKSRLSGYSPGNPVFVHLALPDHCYSSSCISRFRSRCKNKFTANFLATLDHMQIRIMLIMINSGSTADFRGICRSSASDTIANEFNQWCIWRVNRPNIITSYFLNIHGASMRFSCLVNPYYMIPFRCRTYDNGLRGIVSKSGFVFDILHPVHIADNCDRAIQAACIYCTLFPWKLNPKCTPELINSRDWSVVKPNLPKGKRSFACKESVAPELFFVVAQLRKDMPINTNRK